MTLNPSRKKSKRLGVLISGRGSNMVALADAAREGRMPNAEIVLVISDKPGVAGLESAKTLGLNTRVIERRRHLREEHDREIVAALKEHEVDLVCLAGYMRLLSPWFINAYRNRILNIHPSLLPCFPGLDAQRQAIEHGVKFSGCTVHFVDETLDGGPIIAQRIVPVLDDDTEESLAARILVEEHRLYPEAVALVVSGNYAIVGRRVLEGRQRNSPEVTPEG
jgi:phosphoribosylglycinamide formyltransferase-1